MNSAADATLGIAVVCRPDMYCTQQQQQTFYGPGMYYRQQQQTFYGTTFYNLNSLKCPHVNRLLIDDGELTD